MALPRGTISGPQHVYVSWSGTGCMSWTSSHQTTEGSSTENHNARVDNYLPALTDTIVHIAVCLCCYYAVAKLWKLFRVSQWSLHPSIKLIVLSYPSDTSNLSFYLTIYLNLREDKCIDTWGEIISPTLDCLRYLGIY